MSKERIIVVRNAQSVTLYVNGKQKTYKTDSNEEAMEKFYSLQLMREKALKGDKEALDELSAMVDPTYRFEDIEGFEKSSSGRIYLKGSDVPIPGNLYKKIIEYLNFELPIKPLVNFWKLLLLNPDTHVRESLFKFAERFSFPITDKGYFLAYKSVAWKGLADAERAKFISSLFLYYKTNGLDTSKTFVYSIKPNGAEEDYTRYHSFDMLRDDDFKDRSLEEAMQLIEENLTEELQVRVGINELLNMSEKERESLELVGDYYVKIDKKTPSIVLLGQLDELFINLTKVGTFDTPTFTDFHTRSSTIRLGETVKMPREDCDNNPNNTCSAGLHVGAPGYVRNFGGGNKQYVLAVMVNPMNVVSVPSDYNFEKMRTCEYLPYAICELTEDGIEEVDTQYFEDDYANIEVKELEKLLVTEATDNSETLNELIKARLVELKS